MKTWLWWFLHNSLIHPLMGIFQHSLWPVRLHDWSSIKAELSQKSKAPEKDSPVMGLSGAWATAVPKTKEANASVLVHLMGLPGAIDNLAYEHGIRVASAEVRVARMKCLERLADMVSEHFSDEDIQELVEFYSSPIGIRFSTNQSNTFKHFGDIAERFIHEAVEGT